ncbi:MAG: hypothetical protein AAGH71_07935 [Planctomycetota bacterium]
MGPDLARRWLAVLTLVPEHDRESVVRAVERQIHAEFSSISVDASGEDGTDRS